MIRLKLICLLASVLVTTSNAQIINVQGNVKTLYEPVENALITFTELDDTTKSCFTTTDSLGNYSIGLVTSIKENVSAIPTKFELAQNYPNPFSSKTAITYKLNEQTDVRVTIYDILGREVKKYDLNEKPVGVHGIVWDGKNNLGDKVTTGIYFYKIQAGKESLVNKMLFTRGDGAAGNISMNSKFMPVNGLSKSVSVNNSSKSYRVKIENTERTEPRIAEMVMEEVLIENDTTIDFSVNKLPIANAGEDCEVKVGQYVFLDGTQSKVGDGSELFYHWEADTTNPADVYALYAYISETKKVR